MSGRAPPRGPRALVGSVLHSLPAATASSSSQSPTKRVGATPPTGPRSLINGTAKSSNLSISPVNLKGGNSLINGHEPLAGASNAGLDSNIFSRPKHTGKSTESGWLNASASSSSQSQVNGRYDSDLAIRPPEASTSGKGRAVGEPPHPREASRSTPSPSSSNPPSHFAQSPPIETPDLAPLTTVSQKPHGMQPDEGWTNSRPTVRIAWNGLNDTTTSANATPTVATRKARSPSRAPSSIFQLPSPSPPPPPPHLTGGKPSSPPPPPPPSPPPPLPPPSTLPSLSPPIHSPSFPQTASSQSSADKPSIVPQPPDSNPPPLPPLQHFLPLAPLPVQPSFAPPPLPPPKNYSTPPRRACSPSILSWPPSPSRLPPGKNFKVIYDPAIDKDRDGRYRALIETLRTAPLLDGSEPRIKGKGKGKEILLRFDGEVGEGEPDIVVRDPRKVMGFKKLTSLRPGRGNFHEALYEYDSNSIGPPPPKCVLITNLSPLAPNQQIRRHFSVYGNLVSFEPQIDKENGSALGIVFIKYSTHDDAKKCVAKENGKRLGTGSGLGVGIGVRSGLEGEEIRVVFDGEGTKLKAVLKELDERKRREREEKKRKEKEAKLREANASLALEKHSSAPTPTSGQTPSQSDTQLRHQGPQASHSSAQSPLATSHSDSGTGLPATQFHPLPLNPHLRVGSDNPQAPVLRPPPPRLLDAWIKAGEESHGTTHSPRPHATQPSPSSTPAPGPTPYSGHIPQEMDISRSPSPTSRPPDEVSESVKQKEHEDVVAELMKNGMDHIRVEAGAAVTEEDIQNIFGGFKVQKILHDYLGWYVTFKTADSARRAEMVSNLGGARTLAHHMVTITVHSAPTELSAQKVCWSDDELMDQAHQSILKELTSLLEKDIMERVVGANLRRVFAKEKAKRMKEIAMREVGGNLTNEEKSAEKRLLKGLSFKKQRKDVEEDETITAPEVESLRPEDGGDYPEEDREQEDDDAVVERPKKRRKKESSKVKGPATEPVESEDDETLVLEPGSLGVRKRAVSEESEPVKKRQKRDINARSREFEKVAKKKVAKQHIKTEVIDEPFTPEPPDFDPLDVSGVRLSPTSDLSPSPSRSPSPILVRKRPPLPPSPPLNPLELDICEDDEDLYFVRLALASEDATSPAGDAVPPSDNCHPRPFRKHVTGSARTEGYYKISHAEKSAYVAQYALRATAAEPTVEVDPPQPQHVTSSRSNRANARRRAQGLEEINQVQRAVALSKGETAASELCFKFNQLQTRKKHLRFARSPIHDWGLYAMERISRGEMVIEYVGEIIRAQVADKREKAYERQGIGSSYLFRIDEDLVVDATKKGNLGRLINHSCDPNCTAKIITINGEKKIVIYAKQDIELGDEITYDYHFPIEQDKIPCLCGSAKCRGFLN